MFATFRTTNTDPASTPITVLAGTRASAQPVVVHEKMKIKKKYVDQGNPHILLANSGNCCMNLARLHTNPHVVRFMFAPEFVEEILILHQFLLFPCLVLGKNVHYVLIWIRAGSFLSSWRGCIQLRHRLRTEPKQFLDIESLDCQPCQQGSRGKN